MWASPYCGIQSTKDCKGRCVVSGRDYRLGRVSPGLAADRIPVVKPTGGQDRRTGEQFAAALARETEASLNTSPSWRAGQPLLEVERWPAATSADLPRSELRSKGRWG